MIFYFTGTGNSQWVANQLKESLQETVISVNKLLRAEESNYSFSLATGERVIFVFPVHSWGVPGIVLQFIKQLLLDNYKGQPVYGVCTCGDDCGYTREIFAKAISQQGWTFRHFYSVTMPNNYILFPGFDVDTKERETNKLSRAKDLISSVSNSILESELTNIYIQGRFPYLKSRIIYPLFNKYALGKTRFFATDACITCGVCEKICPTRTIYMKEDKPEWKETCIQCLACIHRCPQRAIEYGKITLNKGRYHHPEVK